MFIWGKKIVRRHLGYVADFCPICACAQPFALSRVGSAGHVYFITAGDGELVGYERSCMRCTVALRADPTQYAAMAPQPAAISALIQQTFPGFAEAYRDRLALEASIRQNPAALSTQDRQQLLISPFVLLSARVSEHFEKNIQLDGGRAYLKREIMPILARALRRLRPSEAELQATLTRLVQLKEKIGSKIKLSDLMAELQRPQQADAADPPGAVVAAKALPVFAGDEARPRQNAGRVMRVTAYLTAASVVAVVLASLLPQEAGGATAALWGVMAASAAFAFALYRAGWAVTRGQRWGRSAGIGFSLLLLVMFPIGTVVGLYLLYNLGLKWSEGGTVSA